MAQEFRAVRILPMSDRRRGFEGLSIAEVQAKHFRKRLAAEGGRFGYRSSGLKAPAGTVVLFQFQARVIASAVFIRDERYEEDAAGDDETGGVLHFDPASIRTFEPVDVEGMRAAWPGFRAFGHVKQFLNPAGYPAFRRRLRGVASPGERA